MQLSQLNPITSSTGSQLDPITDCIVPFLKTNYMIGPNCWLDTVCVPNLWSDIIVVPDGRTNQWVKRCSGKVIDLWKFTELLNNLLNT